MVVTHTRDGGATFSSRGMLSPQIWWKSVKVAPRDAQRVYITGYQVEKLNDLMVREIRSFVAGRSRR